MALCCNATGTDKIQPFVIGRAARPRCFGKTFEPSIYADYSYNNKAWMISLLWEKFLTYMNSRARSQGRHYLILCDNSGTHKTDTKCPHITIKYLPPNTTNHIQPLDGGIIASFKAHYRQKVIRRIIPAIEDDQPQTSPDVRQAICMLRSAWVDVTISTIQRVWKHVDILPDMGECTVDRHVQLDEDDIPLAELQALIRSLSQTDDILLAEEYLAIDDNVETGRDLEDSEILDLVQSESDAQSSVQSDTNSDEETDDVPPPPVTISDTRKALMHVQRFFEERNTQNLIPFQGFRRLTKSSSICLSWKVDSKVNHGLFP